jgi:hypothetical protein
MQKHCHGISRKRQKQRHGMKKRQKKKHCHGLTRNFTEKTEAETRNEEHIIRSQMRERRYKYTVWGGPFGKLRDQGSFGTVSELVELAVKFKEGHNIFQHLFRCKT